jgi:multidrug resistance efflux pump
LDFQINSAKLKYEIATRDVILLRDSSEENLELLAKSQVKDLQRQSAWLDLKYYEWQKQFLRIEAPVSGTIVTKAIESLAGKKLKSGEPLCEIVVTEDLWAEAKVPVERIAYVQLGQDFWLYLNDNPLQGHRLKVAEIAPAPTSLEKLGSFYHVRATLIDHQDFFKPGLKGIAKIDTKEASIWVILTTQLVARWNEMSLYF